MKQTLLSINPRSRELRLSGGNQKRPLVQFLLEAGFPVYPLNPKVVDYRRKPSGAKSDRIDARLLASIGQSDLAQLKRLKPDTELVCELKILTRIGQPDPGIHPPEQQAHCLLEGILSSGSSNSSPKPTLPVALEFYKRHPTPGAGKGSYRSGDSRFSEKA